MQCTMKHDKCRNTPEYKYAGQNLATSGMIGMWNATEKIERMIKMWYSEYNVTSIDDIKKYPKRE